MVRITQNAEEVKHIIKILNPDFCEKGKFVTIILYTGQTFSGEITSTTLGIDSDRTTKNAHNYYSSIKLIEENSKQEMEFDALDIKIIRNKKALITAEK